MKSTLAWVLLAFSIILRVSACTAPTSPVQLEKTGEYYTFDISVFRDEFVWVVFPESEYTEEFNLILETEFVIGFGEDDWWYKLHTEISRMYEEEHTTEKESYRIDEIPPIDWLQNNVQATVSGSSIAFYYDLPLDGEFRYVGGEEQYENYIEKYPEDKKELSPMQVVISNQRINTIWEIFRYRYPSIQTEQTDQRAFADTDEAIRKHSGTMLYMFPDGKRYLYIQLPEDLLKLDPNEIGLEEKYETSLKVEILRER